LIRREHRKRIDPQIAQIFADSILICENLRNLRIISSCPSVPCAVSVVMEREDILAAIAYAARQTDHIVLQSR
jgi:hypothetical protein